MALPPRWAGGLSEQVLLATVTLYIRELWSVVLSECKLAAQSAVRGGWAVVVPDLCGRGGPSPTLEQTK